MASVFRKNRSPYWFAAFRDAQGRRAQRSTKQRNRSAAMRIAQEWEKVGEKARARVLTEAQTRRVLSEMLEVVTGESIQFYSCKAWFLEWESGKRGAVEQVTLERYKSLNSSFLKFLGARAELPLVAITPKDARGFRDHLASDGRTARTVNQLMSGLKMPFAVALQLGYISMNPCTAVETLKQEHRPGRSTFTPEQVAALLEAADEDWKGVILCGYFTGLRLSDVVNLTWAAIDLEKNVLRILTRKTGANLVLPMHPELGAWFKKRKEKPGQVAIFPDLAGKLTGGRHGLSHLFSAILDRANIPAQFRESGTGLARKLRTLSFHCLRHSFVSALANAGVPADQRQRLTGHADAEVHARYTHHEIETLRAAVAKLPSVSARL